jgi:hypothetical protein
MVYNSGPGFEYPHIIYFGPRKGIQSLHWWHPTELINLNGFLLKSNKILLETRFELTTFNSTMALKFCLQPKIVWRKPSWCPLQKCVKNNYYSVKSYNRLKVVKQIWSRLSKYVTPLHFNSSVRACHHHVCSFNLNDHDYWS